MALAHQPFEMAALPFCRTTVFRPWVAAYRADGAPAAPNPTMQTSASYVSANSVMGSGFTDQLQRPPPVLAAPSAPASAAFCPSAAALCGLAGEQAASPAPAATAAPPAKAPLMKLRLESSFIVPSFFVCSTSQKP